jgi:hypothetical protein
MVRDIDSGESFTVASGETNLSDGINLDGELNQDGETNIGSIFGASGGGTADTTGSATSTAIYFAAADGFTRAFGIAFDTLQVDSGTTETIAAGDRDRGIGANVGGELNLGGEFDADADDEGNTLRFRLTAADGTADTNGTGDALARRFTAADGDADFDGDATVFFIRALIRSDTLAADFAEDESIGLNAEQD